MTESATADAVYYQQHHHHAHTLNHRAYYYPPQPYKPSAQLTAISESLLTLPSEIRHNIYHLAFKGNRIAVTCRWGCYCASGTSSSSTSGTRYHDDHRWLLSLPPRSPLRMDAQHGFVAEALWEIHCEAAFNSFVNTMTGLGSGCLENVRHVMLNIFETSKDGGWHESLPPLLKTKGLTGLRSVIFKPWQKGWTVDIDATLDQEELSDKSVLDRIRHVLENKDGYGSVREALGLSRETRGGWKLFFLFPIRFRVDHQPDGRRSWRLKIWKADLDDGIIDRNWKDVHLLKEATLD